MPKKVDHAERRREIALGVFHVIAERGIAAVSLRSVAAAAGVSMGRVQYYFSSRDEMVRHACGLFGELAAERYVSRAEEPASARLRHLLTMGVPDGSDARIGSGVWYSFVTAAVTDPVLAEVVRGAWAGMRERVVEDGAGMFDGEGGDLAAEGLASLVDGITLRVMLGHLEPERAVSIIDLHLQRLDDARS